MRTIGKVFPKPAPSPSKPDKEGKAEKNVKSPVETAAPAEKDPE